MLDLLTCLRHVIFDESIANPGGLVDAGSGGRGGGCRRSGGGGWRSRATSSSTSTWEERAQPLHRVRQSGGEPVFFRREADGPPLLQQWISERSDACAGLGRKTIESLLLSSSPNREILSHFLAADEFRIILLVHLASFINFRAWGGRQLSGSVGIAAPQPPALRMMLGKLFCFSGGGGDAAWSPHSSPYGHSVRPNSCRRAAVAACALPSHQQHALINRALVQASASAQARVLEVVEQELELPSQRATVSDISFEVRALKKNFSGMAGVVS